MAYQARETADKVPSVTSSIEDFDGVIERLHKLTDSLRSICNRIYGPDCNRIYGPEIEPCGGEKAPGLNPVPTSLLGSISERRNRLVLIADRLEDITSNLDQGL